MTQNKLLDSILSCYLYGQKLKVDKDPSYKKLSFKLIARSQDPTVDEWNIEFLRKRLFDDGFLQYSKYGDPEPYELTPTGIKAAQTKGYSSSEEEKLLDKKIKEQTLLSLKRSKNAIIISIFAIIVPTIISVYTLWTTQRQTTTQEMKQLKQQLDTIRQEQLKLKESTIFLQRIPSKTTPKVGAGN